MESSSSETIEAKREYDGDYVESNSLLMSNEPIIVYACDEVNGEQFGEITKWEIPISMNIQEMLNKIDVDKVKFVDTKSC